MPDLLYESSESASASLHATRWEGLQKRAISGVIMAAIVLAALWQGGWVFTLLITVAAILMIREWDRLVAGSANVWQGFGVLYVGLPCASAIWLRGIVINNDSYTGAKLVLFVILTVCATDIGAYFAGRRIGGPKLSPRLSPNKTWAGLGGGVVSAAIIGAAFTQVTPYPPSLIAGMDLGIVLALLAQAGDLFESWLKRRAGVKDSGALIPGHGGLLDRVDGMIFTLPLFAWLVHLSMP